MLKSLVLDPVTTLGRAVRSGVFCLGFLNEEREQAACPILSSKSSIGSKSSSSSSSRSSSGSKTSKNNCKQHNPSLGLDTYDPSLGLGTYDPKNSDHFMCRCHSYLL